MTIPTGPESVDTSWDHYVRRFYAAAPADQQAAWAALTADERAAFNATRDYLAVAGSQRSDRIARLAAGGAIALIAWVILLVAFGSGDGAGRAPFDNDLSTCVTKKIVRTPLAPRSQQIHCADGRKFVIPMGE